jgi:CheY-like chemotaxis protein
MVLQRLEYKTFAAATAGETLAMTGVTVPSLIMLSVGLKDMGGLELIQRLKENPATAGIPLIALRRQDDLIGEEQCLNQGVISCLTKPASIEQLYGIIQRALETTPRAYIRVKTLLPVHPGDKPNDYLDNAVTTDLSEGGMYVRTQKPATVRTQLSCQLHVCERDIQMDAVVLYKNRAGGGAYHEPGMGLQFARIESKDRELIRRFVRDEITRGIPSTHD